MSYAEELDMDRRLILGEEFMDCISVMRSFPEWDDRDVMFRLPSWWNANWNDICVIDNKDAVAVVLYEGAWMGEYLSLDRQSYKLYDKMDQYLRDNGYWSEQLTCWASVIYKEKEKA
jgi:hypothetical protein